MIKARTLHAIHQYVDHKVPTGGFLEAVLSNDLAGAVGKADLENGRALAEIVKYVYNEIPADCWGSRDAYVSWLKPKEVTP